MRGISRCRQCDNLVFALDAQPNAICVGGVSQQYVIPQSCASRHVNRDATLLRIPRGFNHVAPIRHGASAGDHLYAITGST